MLEMTLICGNCKERTSKTSSSYWTSEMICNRCVRLGIFMFLRKKKWKPTKETVEPNCDHDFYEVGFVFCTTPKETVPQRCVKCGWHRLIQRE